MTSTMNYRTEKCCPLFPPIRYLVVLMCSFAGGLLYLNRVNLNVTIVAMVVSGSEGNQSADFDKGCPFQGDRSEFNISRNSSSSEGEFSWSQKEQGMILGAFFYGYILLQIVGGRFAEMWGAKWLIGSGILLSGIINLLTPVIARSNSITALVISRIILGMAQSVDFPSGYAMLIRWFPEQERATAFGLFTSGSNVGAIVTMIISGWLSSMSFLGGWPSVFYVAGFAACVWFVLWALLVHSDPSTHPLITKKELDYIRGDNNKQVDQNEIQVKKDLEGGVNDNQVKSSKPSGAPWMKILMSKPVWAVIIMKFTIGWNYLFILTKIPAYLKFIHHYSIDKNGYMMAIIYLCMVISMASGGIIADWINKKKIVSKNIVRKSFEVFSAGGSSLFLALIPLAGCNKTAVIAFFMCSMLCFGQVSGGDIPIIADMSGKYSGTIIAIANSIATLSGILCPIFVGFVIESDNYSRTLWAYTFYFCALLNLFGIIVFLIWGDANQQEFDKDLVEQNDKNTRRKNGKIRNGLDNQAYIQDTRN